MTSWYSYFYPAGDEEVPDNKKNKENVNDKDDDNAV